MGKAFFAVVLVAAAFAGGLATNGASLAKLQALVSGAPTKPGTAAAPVPPADEAPSADAHIPAAHPPGLVLDGPGGLEPPALPPPRRADPNKTDTELVKAGNPTPDSESEPEPLDTQALSPEDKTRPARTDSSDHETSHPRPQPNAIAKVEPTDTPPATTANWDDLRRRMKALGVARYWIEGEPDGLVRFRCLIPTAGGRAVGQHFEAEAEDDLHAAEATLRRVALWKATEQP